MKQSAAGEPTRPGLSEGGHPPAGAAPVRSMKRLNPRDVGVGLLIAVAAAFVYLIYAGAHMRELSEPDAMDYAQVARHLARGEGFSTSFVRPMSLARVQNISHHPDLVHAPLHPLWMSLLFRLGGANYRMAAWSCGIAYLLSLPLIYLLALRLFDRRVALLALAVYAVNYLTLPYAVSGLETSLATLLVTLLLIVLHLYLRSAKASPVLAGLCGAVIALCVLVKYVYLALLLPVLIAVLLRRGERRWAEAVLAVAVFALVMAPWAVRNARVAGSPVFTLESADLVSHTMTYRGESVVRRCLADPPQGLAFLAKHPREAWLKVRPVSLSMYDAIPNLGGAFIASFFIAGIFLRFREESLGPLRLVHYAWIGLLAVALCLVSGDARLLVPISPLVVIVGAAAFLALMERAAERLESPKRKRRLVSWSIAALIVLCWYPVAAMTATMEARESAATEDVRKIATTLGERKAQPLYCDQPWLLAWYGDLDCIWLPQSGDDLRAVENAVGSIQYLLLSPAVTTMAEQEDLGAWAQVYAAARRGVPLPFQRFVAADLMGAQRDWVLCGRLPKGAEEAPEAPTAP